jgi:hypothetical protein
MTVAAACFDGPRAYDDKKKWGLLSFSEKWEKMLIFNDVYFGF